MPWNLTTVRSSGFTVTAAVWNDEIVENMAFLRRVGYVERTSDLSVTSTTEATPNDIATLGAITYEAVPHYFTVFLPRAQAPAGGNMRIGLYKNGSIFAWLTDVVASGNVPCYLVCEDTPTAASHTYKAAAFMSAASTGTIQAGTGGSDFAPAFIAAHRVPT